MDSFLGIGFWEIALIFAVILALIGPRRLPQIAAKLGNFLRQLRRASSDLTTQLTREVEGNPQDMTPSSIGTLKKAATDLAGEFTREKEKSSTEAETATPRQEASSPAEVTKETETPS